jgi:hypothetical protein
MQDFAPECVIENKRNLSKTNKQNDKRLKQIFRACDVTRVMSETTDNLLESPFQNCSSTWGAVAVRCSTEGPQVSRDERKGGVEDQGRRIALGRK